MDKCGILMFSDIHFSFEKDSSQLKVDDANGYYKKLENYIQEIAEKKDIIIKYLIITGDIVDHGKKQEYVVMQKYIERLCDKFELSKDNVLIVPGNHDIYRAGLEIFCDDNNISTTDAAKQHDIKLSHFTDFYKEFYGKKVMDPSKAIVDKIIIEENQTLILGLNSLEKESHLKTDHYGYVSLDKLEKELDDYLKLSYKNIIIATHHSVSETMGKEKATIGNARLLKDTLSLKKINTYIYGHHHTSESRLEVVGDDGKMYRYIEIGSLAKILTNSGGESLTNRFSLLVTEQEGFSLYDFLYTSESWGEINTGSYLHKLEFMGKIEESPSKTNMVEDLPVAEEIDSKKVNNINDEVIISSDSDIYLKQLSRNGFYREGHFHWKNGKKTLGWINISAYLGDINNLHQIEQSIKKLLEINDIRIDAVVGYGMEGNIMGSSLTEYWLQNGIIYYYYPSVHKSEEHLLMEKDLWNKFADYKYMLLICDIMPTDKYLYEIIESSDVLKKCERIYIVSLFYNKNLVSEDKIVKADMSLKAEIVRMTLTKLDVPVCNLDSADCAIYNNANKKIYNL